MPDNAHHLIAASIPPRPDGSLAAKQAAPQATADDFAPIAAAGRRSAVFRHHIPRMSDSMIEATRLQSNLSGFSRRHRVFAGFYFNEPNATFSVSRQGIRHDPGWREACAAHSNARQTCDTGHYSDFKVFLSFISAC